MTRETIDTGIVVAGEVLPGTSWCIRQASAWWDPSDKADHYQMSKRADVVDLLVGHWTAAEAGKRSYEDDGPWVTRGMKRRMSRLDPTRRLRVSVQFVIGACDPDAEHAPVWQTMDIGTDHAAVHTGQRSVNGRSVGVEVVNAGLDGTTNVRDRPEVDVHYLGRHRRVLAFYPGQLRSFVLLANALTERCLPGGIEIPRRVPAELVEPGEVRVLPRRFTPSEQRAWTGVEEHYHMNHMSSRRNRKIDAGTMLCGALLEHGWSPAPL